MGRFRKFSRLILAGLMLALCFSLGTAARTNAETAPAAPVAPQNAPSPAGDAWVDVFGGKYVKTNGFMSQPKTTQVVSPGDGSGTMDAAIKTTVTNLKGTSTRHPQRVDQVSYKMFDSTTNTWPSDFTTPEEVPFTEEEPMVGFTPTVKVPVKPGVYYFQLNIRFDHRDAYDKRPITVYSQVFEVDVLEPDATHLSVSPESETILWGQSVSLDATINPPGAQPKVGWKVVPDKLGVLSKEEGNQTTFTSNIPVDPLDPRLITDNGFSVTVTATANADAGSNPLTANSKVTLGGISPLEVDYGQKLEFISSVSKDNFPGTPEYKWVIYDQNHQVYTPKPDEGVDDSHEKFIWGKVMADRLPQMYYQMQVSFTLPDGTKTTWYSNIARITINNRPVDPKLEAVPNLAFFKSDDSGLPSIADFQQEGGVTLTYSAPLNNDAPNFQGNNEGHLKVTNQATNWSLAVQFDPFVNMTTGRQLYPTGGTGDMTLKFADGEEFTINDDGNSHQLYDSRDQELDTTIVAAETTLHFPPSRDVQPGPYRSMATWTLIQAP